MRIEEMKPMDADVPYPIHLSGNESISPIFDYNDLCKEGNAMHHCIAVYHNRIAQGRYVALRLSQPERMTIGIKVDMNKRFPYEIDQIAGLRNKIPAEGTRERVFEWLLTERKKYKLNEE